jgi:hypothetical protein
MSARRLFQSLTIIAFVQFGCTKANSIQNEVLIDGTADEVFSQMVSLVQDRGFGAEDVSSSERTLKTGFKEIGAGPLPTYANLKEPPGRYENGRYALALKVEESDGKSKLHVDALVEGYYKPPQATSESFGTTDKKWLQEKSTGKAEREFLDSLGK